LNGVRAGQQAHAVFAARDQHVEAPGAFAEELRRRRRVVGAADQTVRGDLGLVMIGRHQRGAGVVVDVRDLRIDEHGNTARASGRHHTRHHVPRHGSLQVVRHEDRVRPGRQPLHLAGHQLLRVAGHFVIAFVVDSGHLQVSRRHDPELRRRAPRRILDEPRGADAGRRQEVMQPTRRAVRAGQADQFDVSAKRPHVVGHVCRAADAVVVVVILDDRDGRLRRDAVHAADHELVEHDVADNQHRRRGEVVDRATKAVESRGHS
jgi:hypothetical protein